MKDKILVIGSSNIDMTMKMDHLPAKGETVTDAVFMQTYGGKGANQAVAAVRAGGNVVFVNAVGDDAHTPKMLDNFKAEGIETQFIFHEKDVASGHALIMIGDEGSNIISVAPGANYKLTPERIDKVKPAFEQAAIILMQYEIPAETIKRVLDIAEKKHIPVMWNLAPARDFDPDYLQKTSILVVNEVEAAFLSSQDVEKDEDIESAARKLRKMGIQTVIISLGKRGAYVLNEETSIKVPAFPVKAKDTTAAGDVFCGSLAAAMVEGRSLRLAVRFANSASALSVTRMGAQPSAPFRKEIDAFLKERMDH